MHFSTTVHAPTPKNSLMMIKFSVEEKVSAPLNVKSVAFVSLTYLIATTVETTVTAENLVWHRFFDDVIIWCI